jgi:hypothetical protein
MSTLMNRDAPLEKCPRCGAKDKFVFSIMFRKNYYLCQALLPNGVSVCNRSTEISTKLGTTDIGKNIDALIAQKQKTPSAVVESPYWKTPATEPPQPEPTPEPVTPAPEQTTSAPVQENPTAPPEQTTSTPLQENPTAPPEQTTSTPVQENPTAPPEQTTSTPVQENPTAAPEATTAPTEA